MAIADKITLTVDTARPTGTRPARRLRREGKIPAVLYGAGVEPTPFAVEWPELRAALTTEAGLNALITLDVDGSEQLTIVKDMQRHPVRRDVLHVDFIAIDRNKAIDVEVPIHLLDTDGDNLKGLVLDQVLFTLPVSAKPDAIPTGLDVSVAELTVDEPVRVSDIALPEGVELNIDAEEAVATASVPQAAPVEDEVDEGEEGEETDGDAEASADGDDAGDADEGGDEG